MPSATSTLQWLRQLQVVIGVPGQQGLQIGSSDATVPALKVQFEIIKTLDPTPNTAQIKIFNLKKDNEKFIVGYLSNAEFKEVLVNAGYQNAQRLIFKGNIKHAFHYRDKTDLITQIEAADGDKDYRQAKLNLTLAAGTTAADVVNAAVGSFNSTTLGHNLIPPGNPRIRGRVISGMTRDVLGKLAREATADWSIQDGALQIVPAGSVLPNQAIVVNASTGMLSAPEINDRGIKVTTLLNPLIGINTVLQLDNNDIKQLIRKRRGLSKNTRKNPNLSTVGLNADGLYKVIRTDHRGDTRGNQWETECYCIAVGTSLPSSPDASVADQTAEGDDVYEGTY